jgi:hypothetical protein
MTTGLQNMFSFYNFPEQNSFKIITIFKSKSY